ncbi:MAG: Crp/Fnr family transcriptional regulator [Phaeodactylibacter sp.]|nr:Crp/Fnr family transcriptional regulator [Phaeodactylibacter sp.]MCB9272848.1 Crp/Fnr family transcriptional regulator [Lewinellaceae bacterium]
MASNESITGQAVSTNCSICTVKSCAVAQLGEIELVLLNDNVARVRFEAGDKLFKEKALNSHVIYLRSGLAKLHVQVAESRDFILRLVSAPSYLGLATIFGDNVNQYSATALTEVEACCIDINTFKELLHNNGVFAAEIIGDISRVELLDFKRYASLSTQSLASLVAGVLLYFSRKIFHSSQYDLPLTRTEIAELLGTTREGVTRMISNFKAEGLINVRRSHISIIKQEALKSIADTGQ